MTEASETSIETSDTTLATESAPVSKERKCLKCRELFPSEWAGERICKRCKSSGSWRNGSV